MHHELLFGIRYAITDYKEACNLIIDKALSSENPKKFAVTPLAVHGLIEGYKNETLKSQINTIDLVVPDGQPIKWALNYFHNAKLNDRVYGPTLMLNLLKSSQGNGVKIFLYGSTENTLVKLRDFINEKYPSVNIVGIQADRFRESTQQEIETDRKTIVDSKANIVFVGRGCPRQERWIADNKDHLPAVLIAVGAAFDFHAGNLEQAPSWMQRNGLEWLYRFTKEPKRLWRRYLLTNTMFVGLFLLYAFKKVFSR
jgi:hypothetical protein